jgi:hypothetical protein
MLDLRSGDAVSVVFDDYNREMLSSETATSAEKYQAMIDRGFSPDVASEIVANYARLESFNRPLYLREVSFSYDADSGLGIELDLGDFIVAGESNAEFEDSDGKRKGAASNKSTDGALLRSGL